MICPYCNGTGEIKASGCSVGTLIKAARKRRGMTQEDLAERLKCSRGLVAIVETGHHMPKLTDLRRWARALGVSVDDLVP